MNPRFLAIQDITKRNRNARSTPPKPSSECFGSHVFNQSVMQKMLPGDICRNLIYAQEGKDKLNPDYADIIALAMKEWAISFGATHYCHWFQPLTGSAAEKHDSFIEWFSPDRVIEKFSGKQLIQGEPDASSFPSGGLRSTYEARGYTGWDPSSPVFLWKGGDGVTLCIPSIFFSWTGDVLDSKIPLLRSDRKINQACLRLLNLVGIPANQVYSTLGAEQEYFVIDRLLRNIRPDLIQIGRTVFGSPAPKGQELQDHYFGAVKDRILSYMRDFEIAALELGIPVKTRHNEVAPSQHEVAPVFEKASLSIDHNILLMELMRQIAVEHGLACLLHEKPFHGLNGSGKHCNWSLATDTGINLLNPTDTPENSLHFLILITAVLHAVYQHSTLLRASIGSASNDFRLGGHEAPPAIISVYLGNELEKVLENIESSGSYKSAKGKNKYDFGIPTLPDMAKDNTDRNRTSPFAFTGNKFEYRAVGSSANPAFPITVLNVIVAESLNSILDEIEAKLAKKNPSEQELVDASLSVIRKYLKESKKIRFSGDNYSLAWQKEAEKRKLPNIHRSIYAFEALRDAKTIKAFEGILTATELESRYEILADIYANTIKIEARIMLDIFTTQILPAAILHQKNTAESLKNVQALKVNVDLAGQAERLESLVKCIENSLIFSNQLKELLENAQSAYDFGDQVAVACESFRRAVDNLEGLVDDSLWPLPKYRELLFLV